MANRYTVGIVGCGSIAHAHMEGYRLVERVEVIAVADPVPPARRQYQEEYGIPQGYASYEEMLDKTKPDIVSVCTDEQAYARLRAQGLGHHQIMFQLFEDGQRTR